MNYIQFLIKLFPLLLILLIQFRKFMNAYFYCRHLWFAVVFHFLEFWLLKRRKKTLIPIIETEKKWTNTRNSHNARFQWWETNRNRWKKCLNFVLEFLYALWITYFIQIQIQIQPILFTKVSHRIQSSGVGAWLTCEFRYKYHAKSCFFSYFLDSRPSKFTRTNFASKRRKKCEARKENEMIKITKKKE